MKRFEFFQGLTRIITDSVSVFLAWFLAYWIRPWTDLIPNVKHHFPLESLPEMSFFIPFVCYGAVGIFFLFLSLGLYKYPAKYLSFPLFFTIIWGVILWVLGIVAVYAFVFHDLIFSRIMLVHAALFTVVFVSFFRFILYILFIKVFPIRKKALLIASTKEEKYFRSSFTKSPFEFQSVFLPDSSVSHFSQKNKNNLETFFEQNSLENISDIFYFEESDSAANLHFLRELSAEKGKILHVIPAYAEEFWGHSYFEVLQGVPMITSSPVRQNYWLFALKRTFDILASSVLILLFSPVLFAVYILIRIDSAGEGIYVSKRVGRNGNLFSMYKFRSMEQNADTKKEELMKKSHRSGPLFKIKNDPRITKIGAFIRKTSIDELPQFFNVLKGDMSLIGPRPHLPDEVAQYDSAQKRILSVRPGISGLAQVSGRSDLSFEREVFLDAYYCENISIWMDLVIFIKTPFVLAFGKGAD